VIIGELEGKMNNEGDVFNLNEYLKNHNFAEKTVEPMHSLVGLR